MVRKRFTEKKGSLNSQGQGRKIVQHYKNKEKIFKVEKVMASR